MIWLRVGPTVGHGQMLLLRRRTGASQQRREAERAGTEPLAGRVDDRVGGPLRMPDTIPPLRARFWYPITGSGA